jgi:hypothetical protein
MFLKSCDLKTGSRLSHFGKGVGFKAGLGVVSTTPFVVLEGGRTYPMATPNRLWRLLSHPLTIPFIYLF